MLCCIVFQLWENTEFELKLVGALTCGWDPKVLYIPYGLSHYWWELIVLCILGRGFMISNGPWDSVFLLDDLKEVC